MHICVCASIYGILTRARARVCVCVHGLLTVCARARISKEHGRVCVCARAERERIKSPLNQEHGANRTVNESTTCNKFTIL